MCWSNYMAIPIILKKPLRVYKVGMSTTSDNFISLYQDFIYYKSQTMPTVEITPEFIRTYYSRMNWIKFISKDSFDIHRGYHSYLTEEAAWIGSILPTTNVDKYYDYLKELGFGISLLYKGEHGVYVVWE